MESVKSDVKYTPHPYTELKNVYMFPNPTVYGDDAVATYTPLFVLHVILVFTGMSSIMNNNRSEVVVELTVTSKFTSKSVHVVVLRG
jgi:hypothetical protein